MRQVILNKFVVEPALIFFSYRFRVPESEEKLRALPSVLTVTWQLALFVVIRGRVHNCVLHSYSTGDYEQ
jgi:hypothetical protein